MHLTPSKQNTNNANNTTCFPCNCLPPKQKMQSIQSLNLYTKIPPKHVTRQFSPTKTKMQSIQSLILCTKLPPKHITCQFSASPAIHGTNIVFTYITNIQIHMYICIIKKLKNPVIKSQYFNSDLGRVSENQCRNRGHRTLRNRASGRQHASTPRYGTYDYTQDYTKTFSPYLICMT